MAVRRNDFPSSEVRERDVTEVVQNSTGTVVAVQGFTNKGEIGVPTLIYSTTAYINTFGKPLNDAEFYTYLAVDNVLTEGGVALVTRLPYANEQSQNYKGIALSIATSADASVSSDVASVSSMLNAYKTLESNAGFRPIEIRNATVSNEYFIKMDATGDFTRPSDDASDEVANCNFFIADIKKSVQDDQYHRGSVFTVIFDPLRALQIQQLLIDSSNADKLRSLNIDIISKLKIDTNTEFDNDAYAVELYGNIFTDSISRRLAQLFPAYEITLTGGGDADYNQLINYEYNNFIGIAVCRVTASDSAVNRNVVEILESFVGCVVPYNNPVTLQSQYIVDVVNSSSSYIKIIANNKNQTDDVTTGKLQLPIRGSAGDLLYVKNSGEWTTTSFGYGSDAKIIEGGKLVGEVKKIFDKISNIDEQQIDVVCDAGLTTVAEFCDGTNGNYFDPDFDTDDSYANGISNPQQISTWIGMANALDAFCSGKRKDCMAIIDAPRNATLNGSSPLISKYDIDKTFGNTLATGFAAVAAALNSSYSATYANWLLVNNPYTGKDTWVPPSCFVAAVCCRCDLQYNPWNSPAFLERGALSGVVGLSLYPSEEEESYLYPKSINYIKHFASDGYIIWGQKTTQKKSGAFDRINVRRSLLRIERFLYNVGRRFIGKGNSIYNRRLWVDIVDPYLADIKTRDGIYDYLPICDETNNTPAVIDANEFRAAALIQPVKEGEFVITDVVATNTGANLSEIAKMVI